MGGEKEKTTNSNNKSLVGKTNRNSDQTQSLEEEALGLLVLIY